MIANVESEYERLRSLGPIGIRELPESSEIRLAKDATIVVWHDVLSTGEHRVVVQGMRKRFFGLMHRVFVRGFSLAADERIRQLTDSELEDFT